MQRSLEGLTEAQLFFQIAGTANSIAWLAWHLNRWQDHQIARMTDEPEVWRGWHAQFGLPAEAHGMGDSAAQVASFRPAFAILIAYVEATHVATVRRVRSMSNSRLNESFQYLPSMPPRTVQESLAIVVRDTGEHTGQIAYIRGLVSNSAWKSDRRLY